ncbi:MAG: hypothetical protein ACI8TX_002918 [Hyphomicrobiaceae bacterium]|jgi:hypothetical protein
MSSPTNATSSGFAQTIAKKTSTSTASAPHPTSRVPCSVLLSYIDEINSLNQSAEWYNAATMNCTTAIEAHLQRLSRDRPFDWRILVNGYIDEMGYERRSINTTFPFAELRERSAISERGISAGDRTDFSVRIREGLPERPPPLTLQ